MCKIFTLSNTAKIKSFKKLATVAASELSAYERDGFGYAILGDKGLFGERTLEPGTFKSALGLPEFDAPYVQAFSNIFGTRGKGSGPALFHGRTSTNDVNLINTHPITKRNWTLIHNGVVSNHGPKYEMITSNDTEHILEYLSTTGVDGIEKHLPGYYAVTAIDPKGRLHVIRDSRASLYAAYLPGLESHVFATNAALIEDVCKAMSWTHSVIKSVQENVYLVFDKNNLIFQRSIKPREVTHFESQHATKSLGREWTYDNWDDYGNGSRESYPYNKSSVLSSITSGNKLDAETTATAVESVVQATLEERRSEAMVLTHDEESFLREVELYSDHNYTFYDYRDTELTHADFIELSDAEKLCCTVLRPDGTLVDPENYSNNVVYPVG